MTLRLSHGSYLLASTATGKTAIAGQVALHVAERHRRSSVSMGLTDVDLGVRLVSVITTIKKGGAGPAKLTDQHIRRYLGFVGCDQAQRSISRRFTEVLLKRSV